MSAVAVADASVDVEQAVLSAFLQGEMTVRPDSVMALAPGDFVDPRHGLIHSAIMAVMLRGAAIDPVTVCDQLDRAGELHAAGGKDYLGFLIDVVPGSVNPASYVSIVRERAQRRRIASQLETVAASVALAATPLVHVSARIEEIGNAVGAAMLPVAESLAATPELDPVALYGIIGDWVRLVAPHTEASPAALLVTAICGVGTMIGRGPFAMIDGTRHGVNNFALLVGPTASGRKGTAVSHVRRLLRTLDADFVVNAVKAGLSTGQGIIYHVRDSRPARADEKGADTGVSDKRLLIVEAEMATGLRQMRRDGNTLSPVIREAWDGLALCTLTKGDPLKATDPHIGIVGQITPEELRKHLDDTEFFSGFLNRFLITWTERSQRLPFGSQPDAAAEEAIAARFAASIATARKIGAASGFAPSGEDWWLDHYDTLTTSAAGRVGAATQRGAAHVRRIALLLAVLEGVRALESAHLEAAYAIWKYAVASARFIFGAADLSQRAKRAEATLIAAGPSGLDRTAIRSGVFASNNVAASDIDAVLAELEQANRATRKKDQSKPGRPREVWIHSRFDTPSTRGKPHGSDGSDGTYLG